MRIIALIAAHDEARFIGGCLDHLHEHGVEAVLLDDGSSDDTVAIASQRLGRGLLRLDTRPYDGAYHWRTLLAWKERLASELAADWFLHLDADEIPLPPPGHATLRDAFVAIDAKGYNAAEFEELTFVPTRESPDHDHPDFRRTMLWYYPFSSGPLHLLRAWKRQPQPVDLASTGGHRVGFPGQRVAPEPFRLRHYLFLSREQARQKYERRRFDAWELDQGWHGWRPSLRVDTMPLPAKAELRVARSDDELDASSPRTEHCVVWPKKKSEPPRIVCVVDRPHWAHDRKTDALARALAGSHRLVKRFQAELTADDLERADGVLFYYWLQVQRLPHLRRTLGALRDRVLIGVCSHYELEGDWRAPALATLNELAAGVFVNNRLLQDELAPLLRPPLFYTPNGVDTDLFSPGESAAAPARRLRVGWAGSLGNQGSERRGVHEVIAPAAERVGAELCLAVREEQWRTPIEMAAFYRSLDVYVCASRSEGTPNPCLEASACGLPVVTTAVGNMPELIRDGDNGFLVARDVDEVAARLAQLRDDPALRQRMGRAARAAAEGWSWRRQAQRFVPLFDLLPMDGGLGGALAASSSLAARPD
ncbi:MAG TPA: glycosyltransferase [Thermoanaerobaculia bacterium]|nr:glycosyltransferase [Thermoanaerobaculia bacterium]